LIVIPHTGEGIEMKIWVSVTVYVCFLLKITHYDFPAPHTLR
jgi:hypothetical protein